MPSPEATYGSNPAGSPRDLVRMLAGDTGRESTGEFWLADTEIDYLIAQRDLVDGTHRPYITAADVLDEMSARAGQRADTVVVGAVQVSNRTDALYSKFSILADKRREQSVTRDPGGTDIVELSGGVDEHHPRYFRTGQFEDRSIYP